MKLTTLLVCDAGLDKRQTIEDLIHSRQNELDAQHRYLQAVTQFALAQAELEQWLTMPINQAVNTLDVTP